MTDTEVLNELTEWLRSRAEMAHTRVLEASRDHRPNTVAEVREDTYYEVLDQLAAKRGDNTNE